MLRSQQRFVLIVDDDHYVVSVFRRTFERQEDFLLDVAMTVEHALQKIRVVQYDLIFLDMKIGTNYAGMEVLRELNRQAIKLEADRLQTPNSLVIIMTSSIQLREVMPEAHELGVVCFMDKPVPLDEKFIRKIVHRVGLPLLPRRSGGGSSPPIH